MTQAELRVRTALLISDIIRKTDLDKSTADYGSVLYVALTDITDSNEDNMNSVIETMIQCFMDEFGYTSYLVRKRRID